MPAEGNSISPITTSRFYVSFEGVEEKMIKSVQEVAFQGQTKGHEKPLAASMKGGKVSTLWQSTSTGYEENPNVTIEVYLCEGDMTFYNWFQAVLPASEGGKGKWAENRKNGSIVAYDASDKEIMRWNLSRAWIKGYKVSDFAADSTELAFETLEMVCEDIKRVKV